MPPDDLRDDKSTVETVEEPELEVVELDEGGQPVDPKQAALLEGDATVDEDDEERTALDDDDAGSRKERRAEQKRIRDLAKQRDQQTIQLLTRQTEELTRRLSFVEGRAAQVDLATLDERIAAAKTQFQNATAHISDSLKKNDHDRYIRALDARDQARDVHRELVGVKRQELFRREQQANGANEEQAPPNPVVASRVGDFQRRFAWWGGPQATDPDSNVVNTLDNGVARSGLDPTTDAYWNELERQMKQYLPHRFKAGANGAGNGAAPRSGNGTVARTPRSPPLAGNGSEAAGARPGYVKITPQRKAAMIEAGAWDDPAKRKSLLKKYADYDKAHPNERPA